MAFMCPRCQSRQLRLSRGRSGWELLLEFLGCCHVRCRDCSFRFTEGLFWPLELGSAMCPKCFATDLTDWDERYNYPPRWKQLCLKVGGKAHRCRGCRLNFLSFRSRKVAFAPSARQRSRITNA